MSLTEDLDMRPYRLSASETSSDETFQKIKKWIMECSESHTSCSQWPLTAGISASLPTRLLQVTPSSQPLAIRLVTTQHLDPAACPYVTLSHCWGNEPLIKLLKGNLNEFFTPTGIPWDLLPLTFQQAISVTRKLGLAYIWIDALCIIQDSDEDWQREAARMMDVYAGCYLNISADSSVDGRGGLFRSREPSEHRTFIIPSTSGSDSETSYCCYITRWLEHVERAPLKERAWVTQERFLSPRVLHFSADQVHWECVEVLTSEGAPNSFRMGVHTTATCSKTEAFGSDTQYTVASTKREAIYSLWYFLIDTYSHAQLTFDSDRPIAVAGLARTFSHFLFLESADYLCGLWRPQFIQGLMWRAYWGPGRVTNTTCPSWSWLSVMSYVTQPRQHDQVRPVAELVSTDVAPLGDPFGPVISAHAKVKAPICKAWVDIRDEPFDYCRHSLTCQGIITVGDLVLQEGKSFFLKLESIAYSSLDDDHTQSYVKELTETPSYLLLGQGGIIETSEPDAESVTNTAE